MEAHRTTESTRRRRGRSLLSGLASTEDFSQDALSQAERVLILYLAVVLTDDQGGIRTLAERLHAEFANRVGHWAYGKSVVSLKNSMSKWLGKCAVRPPTWHRIRDALSVQVQVEDLPSTLAVAAGLFQRATGTVVPDLDGEPVLPAWATDTVVTVTTIRGAPTTPEAPPTLPPDSDAVTKLTRELADTMTMLDLMIRSWREVNTENAKLRAQLDEQPTFRHYRSLAVRFDRLLDRHCDLLRRLNGAEVGDAELRARVLEQIAPGESLLWLFRNKIEWLEPLR